MKRRGKWIVTALMATSWAVPAWPQSAPKAPVASDPVVEIKGKITHVQLAPGRNMPSIEVNTGSERTTTVWLGSMRYMMEQNFSPRAGDAVEVRGFSSKSVKGDDEITAISVKLPNASQALKFRDESGFPVWARGGGPCPECCGPAGGGSGMRRPGGRGMGYRGGHNPCPHRQ